MPILLQVGEFPRVEGTSHLANKTRSMLEIVEAGAARRHGSGCEQREDSGFCADELIARFYASFVVGGRMSMTARDNVIA